MADELTIFQRHWLLIKIGRALAEMDEAAARGDFEAAHGMFLIAGNLLKDLSHLEAHTSASDDGYPTSA